MKNKKIFNVLFAMMFFGASCLFSSNLNASNGMGMDNDTVVAQDCTGANGTCMVSFRAMCILTPKCSFVNKTRMN